MGKRNNTTTLRFWNRESKKQSDHFCWYCNRQVFRQAPDGAINKATVDHIIPLCLGGNNNLDNLVISCFECNNKKSQKEQTDFLKLKELGVVLNGR